MYKVRTALGLGAALAGAMMPAAVLAQSDVPARVGKLEAEMRAVQRKVFPGGAGQTVEPEVREGTAPAVIPGAPSSSALIDLTSRVASLEGQMASLTGQIEQNAFKLRQLQDQFDAYRRSTDAKLAGIGTAGAPVVVGTAGADAGPPPPPRPQTGRGGPARPSHDEPTAVDAAATGPAKVVPAATGAAVERPSTGDAAEDDYLYGYRLWQAKQYPAAEAQLKKVVATYPDSKRASYAQNLLGRAYLDEGKPSLASMAFYDNYKKMPDGERAPDSLYYLAQALMKLDKPADACKVYGELTDVYGAKIGAGMKADVARGRAAAKCK